MLTRRPASGLCSSGSISFVTAKGPKKLTSKVRRKTSEPNPPAVTSSMKMSSIRPAVE